MRIVPCILSVSLVALSACSSSEPQSPAPTSDASATPDAGDDAPSAEDAAPDAAIDSGRDAGACFDCAKTSYTCVDDSDGQSFVVTASKNADGSCAFGNGVLACDGTGKAQNGAPATWSAGPHIGPSGGPGIHVDYGDLVVNCE